MKRITLALLMLAGAVSVSVSTTPALAQQNAVAKPSASLDRPEEPNLVFDDDGGKAQIVPADLSVAAEKKFHGGEVMKAAQQVSIFLGSGWGDAQVRPRQVALGDLSSRQAAGLEELKKNNVHTLSAAPKVEDFSDLKNARVNDLTIQHKLSDLLASKAIPAPGPSTIYVIYLAPGVNSTLGSNKAGLDYAAYHNYVHLDAGEIRYVVVPFHEKEDRHTAAAARGFADAALNPNGAGWY
jgi:hypothetical protein